MPNQFSQLLCIDTIRNANNHLEPGQSTMLACESKPKSKVKSALTILKDHDYSLWIELYEHNLAEKIIGIYSDAIKRKILLHIDKPIPKDEMLRHAGVSQSGAYRKFNELLQDGFILPVGYTKTTNRVRLYDKIISKAEFSVSTRVSQIRLQVNLSRLPKYPIGEIVYP
ncbi:hypothetical protein [Nitrosopumilus adriaticus]|uniref:hypothetical protein n=1 Tax=Nitrosopumilus adriaticus TaxID=1580092 RepID=UPI00352E5EB6